MERRLIHPSSDTASFADLEVIVRQFRSYVLCLVLAGTYATAFADGLIYQLPEDGAWTRFKVTGDAVPPDGTVKVTLHGTPTVRSVGRAVIDSQPFRWIELESEMTFQKGGKPALANELIKILVPEGDLAKGKNPLAHVVRAYRGMSAETLRELDLTGNDARDVQGMDEIFHGPLKEISELPSASVEI